MNDSKYFDILLEEIRGQNRAVIEAVGQVQDQIQLLATKEDVAVVADRVSTVEVALRDTNKDLRVLTTRVGSLEDKVDNMDTRLGSLEIKVETHCCLA